MNRTVSFLAGQPVLRGVRPACQEAARKVFQEGGRQPRVVCAWSARCSTCSGPQMADPQSRVVWSHHRREVAQQVREGGQRV